MAAWSLAGSALNSSCLRRRKTIFWATSGACTWLFANEYPHISSPPATSRTAARTRAHQCSARISSKGLAAHCSVSFFKAGLMSRPLRVSCHLQLAVRAHRQAGSRGLARAGLSRCCDGPWSGRRMAGDSRGPGTCAGWTFWPYPYLRAETTVANTPEGRPDNEAHHMGGAGGYGMPGTARHRDDIHHLYRMYSM